jgi:hypothetical protein
MPEKLISRNDIADLLEKRIEIKKSEISSKVHKKEERNNQI